MQALIALLQSGWEGHESPAGLKESDACIQVGLPVLLRTLDDYTTDRRGDVGSLCVPMTVPCSAPVYFAVFASICDYVSRVREAGMDALLQLCRHLMEKKLLKDDQMSQILADVMCKCFRQAAERIARIREAAANTIMKLLEYQVFPSLCSCLKSLL